MERKDRMIDNRMIDENHQQGIKRVLQRRSERMEADHAGHNGSMANGWKHGRVSDKGFKRTGDSITPRKA